MDLFLGTVDASAQATTHLDPSTPAATSNDNAELVIADYVRPTPAESGYLDTVTSPAPWPSRDAPPGPRGGRPLLGRERKLFATPGS
ncbi:hypothetical protein [Micromonospora sp. NPDC049274]|uniref:hypothetical protein n=1 Tax=Micromonospora sp. NPDC049274 TaxID=3154829 RepID=UPI003448B8B1